MIHPELALGYPGEVPHDASVQVAGSVKRQVSVAQRSSLTQSARTRVGTSARRTQNPRTARVACPDASLAAGADRARSAGDFPIGMIFPRGLARTTGRVGVLPDEPGTDRGGSLKSVSVRGLCQGHPERKSPPPPNPACRWLDVRGPGGPPWRWFARISCPVAGFQASGPRAPQGRVAGSTSWVPDSEQTIRRSPFSGTSL